MNIHIILAALHRRDPQDDGPTAEEFDKMCAVISSNTRLPVEGAHEIPMHQGMRRARPMALRAAVSVALRRRHGGYPG